MLCTLLGPRYEPVMFILHVIYLSLIVVEVILLLTIILEIVHENNQF